MGFDVVQSQTGGPIYSISPIEQLCESEMDAYKVDWNSIQRNKFIQVYYDGSSEGGLILIGIAIAIFFICCGFLGYFIAQKCCKKELSDPPR